MPSGKLYTESQVREHRATELISLVALLKSSSKPDIARCADWILQRLPSIFDDDLECLSPLDLQSWRDLAGKVRAQQEEYDRDKS